MNDLNSFDPELPGERKQKDHEKHTEDHYKEQHDSYSDIYCDNGRTGVYSPSFLFKIQRKEHLGDKACGRGGEIKGERDGHSGAYRAVKRGLSVQNEGVFPDDKP